MASSSDWCLCDACRHVQIAKTKKSIVSFVPWVRLTCQTTTPSRIYHQTSDCYKVTIYSHFMKNLTYSSKRVSSFHKRMCWDFEYNPPSSSCGLKLEEVESRGVGEEGDDEIHKRKGRKKHRGWEVRKARSQVSYSHYWEELFGLTD